MYRIRHLLLAVLLAVPLAAPAQGGNPRNMTECVQMTRAPLESQCRVIFGAPGQETQRSACLERVGPQLQAVCQQFFGDGSDFCSTCTSSCNQAYAAGDGKRRECLTMCLQQPGCQ